MQVFIYFAGILIAASLNCINMFVVTRFDLPTMTEYYRTISNMTLYNGDMDEYFQHQNLPQFCQQLRESIFFDRSNNTHVSDTDDFTYLPWSMSTSDLELERIVADIIQELNHRLYNGITATLPTFLCMNTAGRFSRIIAPGMFPNTAFFSTYRNTQDNLSTIVELKAVIDAPAILHQNPPNFNNFLEARRGLERDPLCDLKRLLKYRLCAAASIGLGPINHRYVYNKYYQPENDEESCRSLGGTDRKSRSYHKMLYCTVKLAHLRVFQSFFLSLDVLQTNNVFFIQQVKNGREYELKTKYLFVPLLEHLELYEEAFKDLDI